MFFDADVDNGDFKGEMRKGSNFNGPSGIFFAFLKRLGMGYSKRRNDSLSTDACVNNKIKAMHLRVLRDSPHSQISLRPVP